MATFSLVSFRALAAPSALTQQPRSSTSSFLRGKGGDRVTLSLFKRLTGQKSFHTQHTRLCCQSPQRQHLQDGHASSISCFTTDFSNPHSIPCKETAATGQETGPEPKVFLGPSFLQCMASWEAQPVTVGTGAGRLSRCWQFRGARTGTPATAAATFPEL